MEIFQTFEKTHYMSLKMNDLSREQVQKLVLEHEMRPAFVGQNPYIASGPHHEILVSLMANGLYQVELLDKKQMEESLQQTIRAFREYAASAKS
jgi:hypothetical protein